MHFLMSESCLWLFQNSFNLQVANHESITRQEYWKVDLLLKFYL